MENITNTKIEKLTLLINNTEAKLELIGDKFYVKNEEFTYNINLTTNKVNHHCVISLNQIHDFTSRGQEVTTRELALFNRIKNILN